MATIYDQTTISQVQQASDIVDIIGEHVRLVKKGREFVGLCPFHDDHKPSMYVNPQKQIFKCFACGAGGDAFKFIQMRESLTFPEAVQRLAERANINLRPIKTNRSGEPAASRIDPNDLAKVNAWAAKHFQANLADNNKGANARDYLKERSISAESIKKWQIGLASINNVLTKTARTARIPDKLLVDAGLITQADSGAPFDRFTNRLMFTITDITGRVIGFGGRTLDGAGAKYINSRTSPLFDKSNSIFGLHQARDAIGKSGTAVVVEGYTDCIMAHQFGCCNVVAALGTSFTTGHARILRRHAQRVVLVFDSDTAGIAASNRALEICLQYRIDIKIATIPQGKDPCDFLLSAGKDAFDQLVESAVDVFQFKWNRLVENLSDSDTFAGRKAATEEFVQTITTAFSGGNLSPVERGLMINQLLSKIAGHGFDTAKIKAELYKRTASNGVPNQKVQRVNLGRGFFAAAQREILEILLNRPEHFETVKKHITPALFDVPPLRQIAEILFQILENDLQAPLASVLARAESIELGNLIVDLADTGQRKANFQDRLRGALEAVDRHSRQITKNRLRTADDPERTLQFYSQNASKQNPHSMGMV